MNKVEINRLANLFLQGASGQVGNFTDVELAKEVGERAAYFEASLADAKLALERRQGDLMAQRPSRESAMELFADALSQLKHKLDDDDLESVAFYVLRASAQDWWTPADFPRIPQRRTPCQRIFHPVAADSGSPTFLVRDCRSIRCGARKTFVFW